MTAELSSHDYLFVQKLVLEGAAITLGPSQEYLVRSRLEPIARDAGLADVPTLIMRLRREPYSVLRNQVIEAMTTNETSFFRDSHPFDALQKNILPELIDNRRAIKTLRIWSAASSCGQEPYSLAMLLTDSFPELKDWTIDILATDLSKVMLRKAQAGIYSALEVGRGLPARSLATHFEREGGGFRVNQRLRGMITWKELNLASPWPVLPKYDLVLMRNVLIYFSPETADGVLRNIYKVLNHDGYLLLGTTENLLNTDTGFEPYIVNKTTFYRRVRGRRSRT